MKTKSKIAIIMGITSIAALPIMASPIVATETPMVPAATVPAATPAAGLEAGAVPSSYVYDGSTYVGLVGNQYYCLNVHKCWVPMNQTETTRFVAWQRSHPDWQAHTTKNLNFRKDADGKIIPLAGGRGQY